MIDLLLISVCLRTVIAVQPANSGFADIAALEYEPAKVTLGTTDLAAAQDISTGRHRRPRRHQPGVTERKLPKPWPCRVQARNRIDHRQLDDADLERMTREGFDGIKRRIANHVRRRRLALKKVLDATTGISAVNDVGSGDLVAGGLGSGSDTPGTGARIKDRGSLIERLN